MKKTAIALSLIALTIGWVSCKKKDDNKVTPIDTVIYTDGVHGLINGQTWSAQYTETSIVSFANHYSVDFGGTDSTNIKLSIHIDDATGPGVHNISTTSADQAYFVIDTGINPVKVYATSGQITITTLNDTVAKGSFNFVAGSNVITNGTFSIK